MAEEKLTLKTLIADTRAITDSRSETLLGHRYKRNLGDILNTVT